MSRRTFPTPAQAARAAWRKLRLMRTAIILLLVLAAASAVGSIFPQRPVSPSTVEAWVARNPGWAPVMEKLGLFDVFGSWWFMAIYVLLLTSLVGCLAPRYRAFFRAVRARPRTTVTLATQPHYHAGSIAIAPDAALARAEGVLREKRFRLVRENGTLAAEKGHLREGGSLVFHTAFLVLLVGISVGKLFGHSGQVALVEGDTFREAAVDYDSITAGRLFRGHKGFTVTLEEFDVRWHPNGVVDQYRARTRLVDADVVRDDEVYVNSPLTYRGVRFYLLSHGWAPEIRVEQRGAVLYEGPTIFLTEGDTHRGVIKVPGTRPLQMGLEMLFIPQPRLGDDGRPFNAGPEARDPLVVYQQYLGDLGLDVAQSVYQLDKRALAPAEVGALRMGETARFPDGITVAFTGLKQYAVFQVASNPGALILLIAAILILVALIPALYSSRRRVWVRAAGSNGTAKLEIAGLALQRKAAFEEEFKGLVQTIDRRLVTIGSDDG